MLHADADAEGGIVEQQQQQQPPPPPLLAPIAASAGPRKRKTLRQAGKMVRSRHSAVSLHRTPHTHGSAPFAGGDGPTLYCGRNGASGSPESCRGSTGESAGCRAGGRSGGDLRRQPCLRPVGADAGGAAPAAHKKELGWVLSDTRFCRGVAQDHGSAVQQLPIIHSHGTVEASKKVPYKQIVVSWLCVVTLVSRCM